MPTLKAMFKLFDGYSATAAKVIKKTDEATSKILKASGVTDAFNKKLEATGASASSAAGGLGKFIGAAALIAGAVKGMDITDDFTNTTSRLNLMNDGLQTQSELQEKIFAAADRSKGAYSSMAGAISKMGITASEAFGSNDELIAFTELLQKSFKVGGSSGTEQASAMLQLTQAMGAGKLQGDEFRSIMENAPMVADAIAKYMGKSKGELKEMSSEGLITADIIKNALFAAGYAINSKFETMPMTFSDVWNKIKNGALKAFAPVMDSVNEIINSPRFQKFINDLIIGFNILAQAADWAITTMIDGWDVIGPLLGFIASVVLVSMITSLWAMIPPLIAQAAAWLVVYWPLLIIIAVISILISAAREFGTSWEDIFGFIGGVIGAFVAFFYNRFVEIWNTVAAFINFLGNVFSNPIASINVLFYDLMVNVLGFIGNMAKGIEDLLNAIPGININIASNITDLRDQLAAESANIKSEAGLIEFVKTKEFMDYSGAAAKGSDIGKNVANTIGEGIDSLTAAMTGPGELNLGGPVEVYGGGKNGAIDVDMSDEDLQYLRDVAERDYVAKIASNTLAPNIVVQFGDVHETADADQVAGRIKKILQEEIATAGEGVYS